MNFADFGVVEGDCDQGFASTCSTPALQRAANQHCVGAQNCTVECSDYENLKQHGCNVSTDGGQAISFNMTTKCPAVAKSVAVDISCLHSGSCSRDSSKLPSFVKSITNAFGRGKLGNFAADSKNISTDPRALQAPSGDGRGIGKLAEGVIIALDIAVTDEEQEYQLSGYFVDWERQGRINSVALLNAAQSQFNVIAPAQILHNFGDGVYLVWKVKGSVRIRISHVGGDPGGEDAPISAVFFDKV